MEFNTITTEINTLQSQQDDKLFLMQLRHNIKQIKQMMIEKNLILFPDSINRLKFVRLNDTSKIRGAKATDRVIKYIIDNFLSKAIYDRYTEFYKKKYPEACNAIIKMDYELFIYFLL